MALGGHDPDLEDSFWPIKMHVKGFNTVMKKTVRTGTKRVVDEGMSGWAPRGTKYNPQAAPSATTGQCVVSHPAPPSVIPRITIILSHTHTHTHAILSSVVPHCYIAIFTQGKF